MESPFPVSAYLSLRRPSLGFLTGLGVEPEQPQEVGSRS